MKHPGDFTLAGVGIGFGLAGLVEAVDSSDDILFGLFLGLLAAAGAVLFTKWPK